MAPSPANQVGIPSLLHLCVGHLQRTHQAFDAAEATCTSQQEQMEALKLENQLESGEISELLEQLQHSHSMVQGAWLQFREDLEDFLSEEVYDSVLPCLSKQFVCSQLPNAMQ